MAKRRRRKSTTAVTHRRRASKPAVRRRRKRSGGLGAGIGAPFKNSLNAGIGGAIYGIGSPMMSSKAMVRSGIGFVASFLAGYFGFPVMGNGIAGAAASDFVQGAIGGLSDDDLEDTEYTDVDLSDQELVADDQGNVFALGDGEQEPIFLGNMNDGSFDLSDGAFDLSDFSGVQRSMSMPTYTD